MALQMSYTAADGTVYPECYITITYILATPDNAQIFSQFYANKAAFEAREERVGYDYADTPPATLNGDLFTMAYAHLLTLPQFAGAVIVD